MKRRRVLIIGAGFSGVALGGYLARYFRRAAEIVLIGRTFPGDRAAHALPLDAPTWTLSARPEAPDDFSRWLLSRRRAADADGYAPQAQHGAYLRDVLKDARRQVLFGGRLKALRGEAMSCRAMEGGWRVGLASGAEHEGDHVVLALGAGRPPPPQALTRAGLAALDGRDVKALRAGPRHGDVLLLGAGLTMLHAALTLCDSGAEGAVYVLSPRGLAPRGRAGGFAPGENDPLRLPPALSEALGALRAEVRRAAGQGEPWQRVLDRLHLDGGAVWRRMPLDAQRRFLRHLAPWWEAHQCGAAPESARRFEALVRGGKVRLLAGELVSAAASKRGVQVLHRQRGSLVRHRLEVARVFDCASPGANAAEAGDVLRLQLLREGLARPHACGLGLDVDQEGRVVAPNGAVWANLNALGPMTRGALWDAARPESISERIPALAALACGR